MNWSSRLLYFLLIPTMLIAAGVLGFYSIEAAQRFAETTEESIFESTLSLVDEKIDRLEQMVITADEAVFHLVDLADPARVEREWPELAPRVSPSVRALVVLDDTGNVTSYSCRCSADESEEFRRLFEERILADLVLEQAPLGQLRHLHRTYGDQSYLLSYRALRHEGRRAYVVAHHDTGYFLRDVFPSIFGNESGKRQYNVVDEDNRRVFGEPLTGAGDYLVGRNFPSTFYGWRLQVAPKQAPTLRAQRESRDYSESALIALSLVIVLLGVAFLIYAQVKERRLNELRSELLANVSHELKTPLSVVRMFSELLLTDRVREDKRKQYLETILRESERLSGLIENLLDFSAIERGKEVYEFREGEITDVVARATDAFRSRHEQGLELKVIAEESLPRVRYDDQGMLLVLMNLLDNAMKYGEPPFEIRLEMGRRHLYVRVRDHGGGIPAEHHKRVFDRFFRLRKPNSSVRGSGIGLALVKRIVEAHGGKVWVETPDGPGALVCFSLPVLDRPPTARLASEESSSAPDAGVAPTSDPSIASRT
ncbi:MAG: HAMP domain-containing histidine kinase [Deltaproteobacteria bacterium]|nr:HAMP domain-containing histidine kinase [Deltaproteobacteria bacterium]